MVKQYYTIRDSKAGIYDERIFSCHTPGEAERIFHQLVNDTNTHIGKYPDDYDLYHIGEFNMETGKFRSTDTPMHIVKGVQLVKSIN